MDHLGSTVVPGCMCRLLPPGGFQHFKPGDIAFSQTRGIGKKLSGFVVMRVAHVSRNEMDSPQLEPHPADRWELALWNLAYDGGRLRRRARAVYVYRFYGERDIADLPALPIMFAPNQEKLRAELIERGKRYHRIICDGQRHMRYNGSVIAEKAYHVSGNPGSGDWTVGRLPS